MNTRAVVRAFSFLFAVAGFVFAGDEGESDERLGCWREEGGTRTLLLEEGRAGWLEDGSPRFHRANYTAEGATFESWGRETVFELRLEGDALQVVGGGRELLMKRLEQVPEDLLVPLYELPSAFELEEGLAEDLTEELRVRRSEDQRVRHNLTSSSPREMQRVDADNTEFLRLVISELGWIDATRFGVEAADAAFLLVQHTSDLRLMRTALPHIEEDVRAGRIDGQNYALLFDRLQLNLGYLQRYGSQIGIQGGEQLLMPCEDIERVDEFRAEMGMGLLSEYLGFFRSDGDPPLRHIGLGQYRDE